MEVNEPALVARCDALRQPVTDLTLSGIRAVMDPKAVPRAMAAINQVSAVLAEGTTGIDSPRYLSWHATASETLRKMMEALEAGDGAASWKLFTDRETLFTDRETGFNELGAACQGCEGW
ncbi:hypothetical protein GCM10017576_21740 [Microbacterium barkeri]|uniref:Uncharacterized protein n=1 Tax=Microbacterium barkeri TaxID=33917 RepID=A0A9W6H4V9_9MICO|nr:hypothetical protein [Microbacterium barkeri]MDI6944037.1 hypothetical protein [Microbacterium barkeri]MDR6876418.1 hypothetical protein [Microbacterium barkeri]GLJ62044.1 hypothetical protein GCM10017576_21740 [Microbacterium barkeri]